MRRYLLILTAWLCGNLALHAQTEKNGYSEVQHLAPDVNFSWVHACYGDSTFFYNESIRGYTYQWYVLGNGSKGNLDTLYASTDTNIAFLFNPAGSYYVELIVNNGHVVSLMLPVVIDSVTTADFDFMHCSNHFVNHSTCATSFSWDFGDGYTSTSELPVHEYADTGHYAVRLISCKGAICDTFQKTINVDATHFPSANFNWSWHHDSLFVHAVDSTAGMLYNWSWGDGSFATGRDTFHVFTDTADTHIMTLLTRNSCQNSFLSDTISKTIASSSAAAPNFSESSLVVLPNPAAGGSALQLYYKSATEETVQLSICNNLGQVIFNSEFLAIAGVNSLKVDLDFLADGVYYGLLQSPNDRSRAKFIIARQP